MDEDVIMAYVNAGVSYTAIGKKYGVTPEAVGRIARKNGVHRSVSSYDDIPDLGGKDKFDPIFIENFSREWNRARGK